MTRRQLLLMAVVVGVFVWVLSPPPVMLGIATVGVVGAVCFAWEVGL